MKRNKTKNQLWKYGRAANTSCAVGGFNRDDLHEGLLQFAASQLYVFTLLNVCIFYAIQMATNIQRGDYERYA